MTCGAFVQVLDRDVTGDLPAGVRAASGRHVTCCAHCLQYLHDDWPRPRPRAPCCARATISRTMCRPLVTAIVGSMVTPEEIDNLADRPH